MDQRQWALKAATAVLTTNGWNKETATQFVQAVAGSTEAEAREALAIAHAALAFEGRLAESEKAVTG